MAVAWFTTFSQPFNIERTSKFWNNLHVFKYNEMRKDIGTRGRSCTTYLTSKAGTKGSALELLPSARDFQAPRRLPPQFILPMRTFTHAMAICLEHSNALQHLSPASLWKRLGPPYALKMPANADQLLTQGPPAKPTPLHAGTSWKAAGRL